MLEVVVAGEVATLVANIVDPDGELDMVTIEWGDGTNDTVTNGFPAVRLDHTYTGDGDFTIVLEARSASGQSAIATTAASITAFAAEANASPALSDGDAGGSGSGTGSSNSGGGSGGGNTPPPPTPSPAPAPSPEPEPAPEEPAPDPIPEPVTRNLLDDEIVVTLEASDPDGAGGSAEAVQQGAHGFGLRTYAWHGYNGSGRAKGTLERAVDATAVLADMPDEVTAVTADVTYHLDAPVELKGPHDRSSTFVLTLADLGGSGSGTTLERVTVENDNANPIKHKAPASHTGYLGTTLTRDQPIATFQIEAECTSTSGSQAFALFNEGYCDALESGRIQLLRLRVIFTPVIED